MSRFPTLMTKKGAILASPMLCLAVLSVIAADNARHVKPRDVEPYHARAKAAIDQFPYVIDSGSVTGVDMDVPAAAVKLLHPNALISRRYTNHRGDGRWAWADLLISQCADSRDMTGHYPPMCYPSNGEPLLRSWPFHLKAGEVWIDGTVYQFLARPGQTGCERKNVYNFFIVPGRGIVPEIGDVRSAAGDYQRRYFGAAQFQVIIDGDLPPEVGDEVFTTLIGSDVGVLKILESANTRD
jgi:hypothetical protein